MLYLRGMAGINKVILVGNLGQNPELRYTPNGIAVCTLRIATSESYTDRASGERITNTEWHNVVLWRGLAETPRQPAANPSGHLSWSQTPGSHGVAAMVVVGVNC